jgi:Mn2+/Fe2+ NRAMP family transporter
MQSAMTLGGGTAFAAIFAGAAFGYQLLWVAPLGMIMGVIMMAAVAHVTLSNDMDPFDAMARYAGGFFAYAWAIGGILSSIIWQFAQYALASAMLQAMAAQAGWDVPQWTMGVFALAWCIGVAMLYGRSRRLVRVYESILKGMVWLIIIAMGWVVIKTGIPNPADLLGGLTPFDIPDNFLIGDGTSISGGALVVSGLAAAVGANMVFVYPYTLRARGWSAGHRRLARFDLIFGMLIPYIIAASLILIASASIFHYADPELFTGKKITPWTAAQMLASPDRLGPVVGMWIFGLGIVAMALSSITMQMLCSGFALSKLTGHDTHGPIYRIGMLLPAVGVLGSVYWSDMALWVAVPTNILCGFMLPLSYIGFIILTRSRAYLGPATLSGVKGALWTTGMIGSTLVLMTFLVWFAVTKMPGWFQSVTKSAMIAADVVT